MYNDKNYNKRNGRYFFVQTNCTDNVWLSEKPEFCEGLL